MISGFWRPLSSSLRPRQHIEERLTLIIDFYHLLLRLFSEAFDKRTNRVSTDVADKHARYISGVLLSPAKSRRSDELGDNGAHRCVDYCFCKRTAIISAARYAIANAKLPRYLVPLPREWRPTDHVFWHLHVLLIKFALFNWIDWNTDKANPDFLCL